MMRILRTMKMLWLKVLTKVPCSCPLKFFLVKYNCSWIKPQIYAIMTNRTFWYEYWNFISILFTVNYLKLLLTE